MLNKTALWISIMCLGCMCNMGCDSTSSGEYPYSEADSIPACTPTRPGGYCDVTTAEDCSHEEEICKCALICGIFEPPIEETHEWQCAPPLPVNPEACPDSLPTICGACSPSGLSCVWDEGCGKRSGAKCEDGYWECWGGAK